MDATNILHLIEEVKKRPALWDVHHPDHRDRTNVPQMWEQIAETIGISDVEQVKRKWKNLRDAFRAEVRRTQRRAEKYKNLEKKDPRSRGTSKWVYFMPMSFIISAKPADRPSRSPANSGGSVASNENTRQSPLTEIAGIAVVDTADIATATTTTNDAALNETQTEDSVSYIPNTTTTTTQIKEEPIHCYSTDDESTAAAADIEMNEDLMQQQQQQQHDDDMDEVNNEMLFEEFQSLATPQAMRRLSHRISMEQAAAEDAQIAAQFVSTTNAANSSSNNNINTLTFAPAAPAAAIGATTTTAAAADTNTPTTKIPNTHKCKCSQRVDEQVHFLQNLEREEEKLMQSTRQDITRCQNMLHVGDSDYNFLISFLPLMKKMNDIQNINFRAKMSELLVHTLGMNQTAAQAANMQQMYANFNPTTATTLPTVQSQQQQQQLQQQQQQQLFMLQQMPQSTTSSVSMANRTQSSDNNTPQVSTSSNPWN